MAGAHHVISDVQAEGSCSAVDEGRGVGGEGGQADVQHVVRLRRQVKGRGGERRLLPLSDVVKFTLSEEDTAEVEGFRRGNVVYFSVTKPKLPTRNIKCADGHFVTFKPSSIEEVVTAGEDTMEYSISAYWSTLARTAVRQNVSRSLTASMKHPNI